MYNLELALKLIKKHGVRLSKTELNYIYEEFDDDLFPYEYGDGSLETTLKNLLSLINDLRSGKIDLRGSFEDRLARRYENLREEHLALLAWLNKHAFVSDSSDDPFDLSF